MTNREFYSGLAEQFYHSDTMDITGLEIQWLLDYEQAIASLSPEEREALENAPYHN